jgi:hypothetical protein
MNTPVLVVALLVVGSIIGALALRLYPAVGKERIFAGLVSLFGSISIVSRPTTAPFWYYTAVMIGAMAGTFLVLVLLRRNRTS